MKFVRHFPLVEVTILLYAMWQSLDLVNAWRHSPHDHLAWIALLVWLVPVFVHLSARAEIAANPYLLGAAILAGVLSALTEIHFFGHVALALALTAWLKGSPRTLLWLLTSVAWMPAFGWWLANASSGTVLALRLLVSLLGLICLWPKTRNVKQL